MGGQGMLENRATEDQTAKLRAQLVKMSMSYGVSRLLHVAAKLSLADYLADGPKSADELSGPTGTHAPSLYRAMRALCDLGLFTEDTAHRFSLTPLSEVLKTDVAGSYKTTVLMLTGDMFCRAMDNLLYSVQTGKPGFEQAFGVPFFDWLENHPEQASMFSQTMVGYHGTEHKAVASAYDFSGLGMIVDVGGATGNFLIAILECYPQPRGILFDMPHVVCDAPALIQSHSLQDRIRIEAGSFFDHVPQGGDAYLLSQIIHDWEEGQCLTVLGNCRNAMKPDSRLLIVERVLPSSGARHPAKRLDISMLVLTGGQERTEQEYRELLSKAGFRLSQIVPTESTVSVMEAFPV
jgi:O-methyltransferase domain